MKKLCVWAVAALLMAACTPKAEKAVSYTHLRAHETKANCFSDGSRQRRTDA